MESADIDPNCEIGANLKLGATVCKSGGVLFAVWAPNPAIQRLGVAVKTPDDATHRAEMARVAIPAHRALRHFPGLTTRSGLFAVHVPTARAGDRYQLEFEVANPSGDCNAEPTRFVKADPRARAVVDDGWWGVIVDPSYPRVAFAGVPPEKQVIYEMHLPTFCSHDKHCLDPAKNETVYGTWESARQKLDYLKTLGVTMIEVMPPAEFERTSDWGYSTVFPYAMKRSFGAGSRASASANTAVDEARAFIQEAHRRGIGVIIDVVYNHFGPYMLDRALYRFDGSGDPDDVSQGGVYFYEGAMGDTGWGPRPNFDEPEVQHFILDNADMWADEYGVDGLRVDMILSMHRSQGQSIPAGWALLKDLTDTAHTRSSPLRMFAENMELEQPYSAQVTVPPEDGLGFDSQWDDSFVHRLRWNLSARSDALAHRYGAVSDGERDMNDLARIISRGSLRVTRYSESHDEVAQGQARVPQDASRFDPAQQGPEGTFAQKMATLGAAITFTTPGTPMMFQFQEVLQDDYFRKEYEEEQNGRSVPPLDWSRQQRFSGIRDLFSDLIHLRTNHWSNTGALLTDAVHVHHVNDNGAKVLAYTRGPSEDVVVIANFSKRSLPFADANSPDQQHEGSPVYHVGMPSAGPWHVVFNSDSRAYSSSFGDSGPGATLPVEAVPSWHENGYKDGKTYWASVELAPYSAIIVSKTPCAAVGTRACPKVAPTRP